MTTDQLLERIAIALEARTGRPQMGFVSSNVQYVWIGWEGATACWYYRENDVNVPIEHTKVIGKLIGLKQKVKQYKGKPNEKLVVQLDCGDKKIYLESGLDTAFSRSFLSKLSTANILKDTPITIVVSRGREESIVFCSVYTVESALTGEWDGSISTKDLLNKCCQRFGFTSLPEKTKQIEPGSRGELDLAITSEFRRLQDHGVAIETIREMATKKFPGFTKSTALTSPQAYQLLEMLKNVEIPL
jgi:hypothetical protein